ncbi:UBE3B [Cordylochernes scorpioides]|uniref:UBE3B n=1 Tax=Cordylochernes scorpioides TaxID=51811 RepID=A0ABY6L4L9_9ARAC|nr:UBE3B [Cordylochernes scorpioides]
MSTLEFLGSTLYDFTLPRMLHQQQSDVSQFLEQAKAARQERALERRREEAALTIQRYFRGNRGRTQFQREVYSIFDGLFKEFEGTVPPPGLPALDMYLAIKKFLFVFRPIPDRQSYLQVALSKQHALGSVRQIKSLLSSSCQYLDILKVESGAEAKSVTVHLHLLVTFTSPTTWALLRLKQCELALSPLSMSQCVRPCR